MRRPVQQIPIGAIDASSDPLLDTPGLIKEQREYLRGLMETGMVMLALRVARQRLKTGSVNMMVVRRWRQESPLFAEIEQEAKGWYWDARAEKVQEAITNGRKFTGGEANLIMQQFNRAKPEEYLPPLVTQLHQTVSYQVEGSFRDEEEKPVIQPQETPTKVN